MTYTPVFNRKSPLAEPLVKRVFDIAKGNSCQTYLVGGYVRDLLWDGNSDSQRHSKDIDFAVAGKTALDFAKTVSAEMSGHYVILDADFDTARVVLDDGNSLDFSGCVGGTIESDLKRRDFTINALAVDAKKPDCVIDLFNAVDDIEKRVVRAVSKSVLTDDPLRLLRAFRFKAVLQAEIELETLSWIKESAEQITRVAAERINVEMFTLLESEKCAEVLQELGDTQMLEAIYPELRACRKVTANAYHHLGLFEHSLEAVNQLEKKLPELPAWVHQSCKEELSFGVSRLAACKLATLLHDIGKPDTWEINEEGRHCFYGHDNLGAEMADVMAERMKWSKPVSRFISKLIKWHLRPGALFHDGEPSVKAIQRFYRKVGTDMPELMMLAFGDLGATRGGGLPEESRIILAGKLMELLDGYPIFIEEVVKKPRLLTGEEVMAILNITPGPRVGEILEALAEAQGLKKITDRDAAVEFVRNFERTP